MKRQYQNLDVIKQKINQLKGKDVKIRLNKGRNKIQFFKGRINETYSSVFVIQIFDSVFDRLSCTYQDVLCGDVKFKLIEKV
ncbi:MAG: Veg family protein [Clostridia bacterium]|nr:Veg family protein [Clostridia bacterium]